MLVPVVIDLLTHFVLILTGRFGNIYLFLLVAVVMVIEQIMDIALLKQLEHLKEQCGYLLAFVSRKNEAMMYILQNIKFINRVIEVEDINN